MSETFTFICSNITCISNQIGTSIIEQVDKIMSALIDNQIFKGKTSPDNAATEPQKEQTLMTGLSRNLSGSEDTLLVTDSYSVATSLSKIDLVNESFMVKLVVEKQTSSTHVTISLLDQSLPAKIRSKHNQILLTKELLRREKEFPVQANFYIYRGQVTMVMNNWMMDCKNIKKNRLAQLYNRIIIKNLLNFQAILQKYLRVGKNAEKYQTKDMENITQFQKQLSLSQILNTVNSNLDLSQDKVQYRFGDESIQTQKDQLTRVEKQIARANFFENCTGAVFRMVAREFTSDWTKNNFIQLYVNCQKKFTNLMKQPRIAADKSIQEFIFNMVKVELKQIYPHPIGEGGFGKIFAARTNLTFISSTDHSIYVTANEASCQKIIAIKMVKSEDRKQREKLQNEKAIISKLRGSCSYFIPKYYGTQAKSELNNALLMEVIQGDRYDNFLTEKADTLSLWTKVYLLLNIVSGLRHLNGYNIVHLDLKPLNIMVCRSLIPKILDYGEAYHKDVSKKNHCPGFTFPYVAPEVYVRFIRQNFNKGDDNLEFSEKQDVFAFGILMSETIFDSRLFYLSYLKERQIYARREILQRLFMAAQRVQDYGDETILSTLLSMIIRCIDPDPRRRPKLDWIGIALRLILNSYSNI